jgi:hypothetical protein
MGPPDFYSYMETGRRDEENSKDLYERAEKEGLIPSRARSLLSSPLKGFLRTASSVNPLNPSSLLSPKLKENVLEQVLPTQEKMPEKFLQKTGEYLPYAIGGEGSLIKKGLQSAAGGLAKQLSEESGAPEWAQELIGAAGMSIPDLARALGSRNLRGAASQKPLIEHLKKAGFSEKEITLIIQNPKKLSALSKAAFKFEDKNPFLRNIKEKFSSNLYEPIREQGQKGNFLEGESLRKFENDFHSILDKIPKRHQKLIKSEIEDLFNNPINFTELHDFNVALNDIMKGTTGGKASIGKLKAATHDAQKVLDRNLFDELRLTDKAYSKYHDFLDKMTANNWQMLFNMGHAGSAIWGLLSLNPIYLKSAVVGGITRYSLRKLLTSPRLQNMHLKLWEAVRKNNRSQALKLSEKILEDLKGNSTQS